LARAIAGIAYGFGGRLLWRCRGGLGGPVFLGTGGRQNFGNRHFLVFSHQMASATPRTAELPEQDEPRRENDAKTVFFRSLESS
jgi:hypothetical protein